MKKQLRGSLSLLLATIIWGSTFVAQCVGMDHIGPFTFQAIRCGLAVIVLLPVIWFFDQKKDDGQTYLSRWLNKDLWKAGLLCAIPLFLAVNLQQVGIVHTDAGKAAFLTAMYILIVPFLGLFLHRKVSKMIFIGVIFAVIGLYLLCCVGVTQISSSDILLIACAFMFALQITFVDRFARSVDPLRLNCIQALVCAVFSGVIMFWESPSIDNIIACWLPLGYAGILSMGAAYSLQIIGQKHVEPTTASLIMSLESVFAVVFSWLLLKETMTPYEAIGSCLVFIGVILSQIQPKKKQV